MDITQAEKTITSAFDALLEKLHSQKEFDARILIDDLHRLAKALNIGDKVPINLHSKEDDFSLDYKNIAQESLDSYAQTKESVEKINQEQKRLLDNNAQLQEKKSTDILNQFSSIYNQVETQMQEANDTIKALRNKVLQLEKTSNLDPLTRTYNRRALEGYLGSICQIDNRKFETYILMIDIDDFKIVNDEYGHLAGDRVLIFLAKLISNTLRDGDKVFRFGGEEFLVLLTRSSEDIANKVANRILNGVRNNTLLYKQYQIKITLSVGITHFRNGDTYDSFIERADSALYKAKDSGKDQIIIG